jgi:hypothetical protein
MFRTIVPVCQLNRVVVGIRSRENAAIALKRATGEHFTVSNQRADWLTRHNLYLFEEVPESDYIKGIDC